MRSYDGEAPLRPACSHGHRNTALLQLDRGADTDPWSAHGRAPIDVTRVQGPRPMVLVTVMLLLKRGFGKYRRGEHT